MTTTIYTERKESKTCPKTLKVIKTSNGDHVVVLCGPSYLNQAERVFRGTLEGCRDWYRKNW